MKITAFILAISLMFCLVGCDYANIQSESSQISDSSNISDNSSEESIDPSEFFPDNMSIYDVVIRTAEYESFKQTEFDTEYMEVLYGYKTSSAAARYIAKDMLDLRSIENKGKMGNDAARDSHIVMLGDCLLIAIAVYDMEENTAYVVKDSTNSQVIRNDTYYTHTDSEKANEGNNYGQAVKCSFEVDENSCYEYRLTYGYPVWNYVIKKYRSIPEDYVLTLTEKLYENDEVVSEKVTLTLTYKDIQEALE